MAEQPPGLPLIPGRRLSLHASRVGIGNQRLQVDREQAFRSSPQCLIDGRTQIGRELLVAVGLRPPALIRFRVEWNDHDSFVVGWKVARHVGQPQEYGVPYTYP